MTVCWGFTASFCTFSQVLPVFESISRENNMIPVCSPSVVTTDTRFGSASEQIESIEKICGRKIIRTLSEAEPIGPVLRPDIMLIAPCTGNTLGKLSGGIYDTPVTLGAKAHLRNEKPLLIAFASNDGLSMSFANIADIYTRKNIFFVPMRQDDIKKKPNSLVADFNLIPECITLAMNGKQLLPLFR